MGCRCSRPDRSRSSIACALISRPTILIGDEPSTALDVTIQAQIFDLLRHLAIERRTAVVLITHDMGLVADTADRVAVMFAGRIAESGPTEAIFAAPRHPYTALLLASIPRLSDTPKSELATIEGRVPHTGEDGSGSPLHQPLPARGMHSAAAKPRDCAASAPTTSPPVTMPKRWHERYAADHRPEGSLPRPGRRADPRRGRRVGRITPTVALDTVDLPQPLSPTRPRVSWGANSQAPMATARWRATWFEPAGRTRDQSLTGRPRTPRQIAGGDSCIIKARSDRGSHTPKRTVLPPCIVRCPW